MIGGLLCRSKLICSWVLWINLLNMLKKVRSCHKYLKNSFSLEYFVCFVLYAFPKRLMNESQEHHSTRFLQQVIKKLWSCLWPKFCMHEPVHRRGSNCPMYVEKEIQLTFKSWYCVTSCTFTLPWSRFRKSYAQS